MGRSPPCTSKDSGIRLGPWTAEEDVIFREYITNHGEGKWNSVAKKAGLNRSGKSCRLRWINYLRPDIKRGNISVDEEELIIRLHGLLGNRWSLIAGRLSGRTDNEIKNYWNTNLRKKLFPQDQALPSPKKKLNRAHSEDQALPSPKKKLNLAHSEDQYVLKSAPIKPKAIRLARCCNNGANSILEHQDLNSPVGAKNMNNSKFSEEKLLTENDFGFINLGIQKNSSQVGFPSTQNIDQFSPPFTPNSVESLLLPSKHGTENESEPSGSSLNFYQLQHVDIGFLSWPYYDLDNLRIETRSDNSLEQGMEGIYRSSEQYDRLNELQYL